MQVRDKIIINKSDRTYRFWKRLIRLKWADDPQKLKWSKRDILFCNEANELSYLWEFFQLLIRTKDLVFIDFNPDDEDIWINTELEQKRLINKWDVKLVVSTYKDNPFLESQEVDEIENIKTIDIQLRQVYWKWWYWKITWLIFPNVNIVKEIPKESNFICNWKDFWFTAHPTTLIWIYMYNNELYLDQRLWSTWLVNTYRNESEKEKSITWNYEILGITKTEEIFADSAEPKSIEEIYNCWYNIKWATKWPDSVQFWITTMKWYKINVTERSLDLRKEFRKYKRAEDKNWKTLNVPIKKFDHGIDAVRYWCIMKLPKKKKRWVYFSVI